MKKIFVLLAFCALAFACGKENADKKGGGNDNRPATIVGKVLGDNGAAIAGVVVSDGLNCVKTDASGSYALPADLTKATYVFVSTPAEWAAPVASESGMPVFWKFLKDCTIGTDSKYEINFTLKRIANPERYTVFIFADPQPRRNTTTSGSNVPTDQYAYKSLDCCDDMYADMKELARTMTDRPVYGIALGDIVHQDLTLLADYKAGMKTTGIRTYNVIGNHDQGHTVCDVMQDDQAHKAFEAEMGPVNYSFNLGGMHYLVLDNMIAPPAGSTDSEGNIQYTDDCATGLTDDIWKWVQNDLKHVPFSTPIMVCVHSPMFKGLGNNGTTHAAVIKERTGQHIPDLKNLLSKYSKSYGWAGHTHSTFNYVDKNDDKVTETHTLGRVTGALWSNEWQSSNGTPRGYLVFEYDNGDISWKFKPIFYQTGTYQKTSKPDYTYRDWDYVGGRAKMKGTGENLTDAYQMQLYAPGVYGDSYIYANIFMWDEKWGQPQLWIDNVPVGNMQRVTENDKDKFFSYSNWELNKFYYKTRGLSVFKDGYENGMNNCASMFRAYVNTEHGTGKVKVRDRFGNDYESTITW